MTQQEFQAKMEKRFEEPFTILEYNDLAKPVRYLCPRCGNEKSMKSARELFGTYSLCRTCYGGEGQATKARTLEVVEKEGKFTLVTWRGMKREATWRCNKCGRTFNDTPNHILTHYTMCPHCTTNPETIDTMMQEDIDKEFGKGKFLLLSRKNARGNIRCLACNFIFSSNIQKFVDFHKECPKCKKARLLAEKEASEFLEGSTTILDEE